MYQLTQLAREHHRDLLVQARRQLARQQRRPAPATPPAQMTVVPTVTRRAPVTPTITDVIARRCSALAALAAAVALAVAACGSTPGPVPTPPVSPTINPPTPAPASFSGTTPQENSSFPYDPGGVTFYGGSAGGLLTFSIPAGSYDLNVQASYDPANDPDDSGQCLFGGRLDYLSGSAGITVTRFGVPVPIVTWMPYHFGPFEVNEAAGDYKIYILPETTCSWTVELWR
jgi:hypothetical protein